MSYLEELLYKLRLCGLRDAGRDDGRLCLPVQAEGGQGGQARHGLPDDDLSRGHTALQHLLSHINSILGHVHNLLH